MVTQVPVITRWVTILPVGLFYVSPIPGVKTPPPCPLATWDPAFVESDGYMESGSYLGDDFGR